MFAFQNYCLFIQFISLTIYYFKVFNIVIHILFIQINYDLFINYTSLIKIIKRQKLNLSCSFFFSYCVFVCFFKFKCLLLSCARLDWTVRHAVEFQSDTQPSFVFIYIASGGARKKQTERSQDKERDIYIREFILVMKIPFIPDFAIRNIEINLPNK